MTARVPSEFINMQLSRFTSNESLRLALTLALCTLSVCAADTDESASQNLTYQYGAFEATTGNRSLIVPLPPNPAFVEPGNLTNLTIDLVKNSYSSILRQLGSSPGNVTSTTERDALVIAAAFQDFYENEIVNSTAVSRNRRDGLKINSVLRDLGGVGSDIGCGITALAAVPVFAGAAAVFAASNTRPTTISGHQNYFVNALHGDVAYSGQISPLQCFNDSNNAQRLLPFIIKRSMPLDLKSHRP
jgi:hypothetical protein